MRKSPKWRHIFDVVSVDVTNEKALFDIFLIWFQRLKQTTLEEKIGEVDWWKIE